MVIILTSYSESRFQILIQRPAVLNESLCFLPQSLPADPGIIFSNRPEPLPAYFQFIIDTHPAVRCSIVSAATTSLNIQTINDSCNHGTRRSNSESFDTMTFDFWSSGSWPLNHLHKIRPRWMLIYITNMGRLFEGREACTITLVLSRGRILVYVKDTDQGDVTP
jgi:hypothetical protein